ncbi:PLP-dependent aminotransferase family protein [Bordetella sp. 15P40C-2]|uniref:MocR-like pyridoxine biosynthesis transcription factor PdxR n=1 Tax=Bordetella sp. 15P40C-2 TaxID=2572246 RepID=UPI00132BCC88|nr:PLP-dependent aminotransferase family protein [Bordetella sp. 15P40C-2]MVW70033.1 aminotransferase class I/II-fold pyridoxal phosphate-dependent enzyme [Bordetella sp. 15P40C-2]
MRSICADLLLQRFDLDAAQPRNRQLYACLRAAILDGSLTPMSRLPSSRDLAQELGVSRNTVIHAYDQLLAEGYVHSRVGSGTFVSATAPDRFLNIDGADNRAAADTTTTPLSRRATRLIERAQAAPKQWGAFMPGVPDVTAFPHRQYARILAKLWRTPSPELLTYASGGGRPELRQALAAHLRIARSIRCDPEQILITEGVHQAIDLTVKMLVDPRQSVWVEDPGYWGFRSVLGMEQGIRVVAVPVDAQGLCIPDRPGRPRLIFVTPSHQYPLGSVMSMARRQELIAFARANGAWIVEDDYDSEFRFGGHPIPAMQGMDAATPVIYVGTFSKTLYPGLRMGYMVVPRGLAKAFHTAQADLYREGHALTQLALAQLIADGHYASHIRRMRLLYARRRSFLVGLIEKHLGAEFLHSQDSNAGLHVVLRLPDHVDDVALQQTLAQRGILVRALSRYYVRAKPQRGLLLGYAGVPESHITAAFGELLSVLRASGIGVSQR